MPTQYLGRRLCETVNSKGLMLYSARRHLTKDRTWNASHGIKFHRPSQLRRSTWSPACGIGAGCLDSSTSFADRMTESRSYTISSNHTVANDGLNLRVSGTLSYPDLSLSSFATGNNESGSIYSTSAGPRLALWNRGVQPEDLKSTSTVQADSARAGSGTDGPFRSPCGFHIPKAKLENAMNSKPGSVASYWQYTLYEGSDGEKQKVKLHYCKTKESTEAISQLFLNEEVIGFDIEWMAQAKSTDGIKKNVALIQIACEERIALFHVARFPGLEASEDLVAPTFKQIMESPAITKVGVAIKSDCTRLKNFLGIHCQGLFELSYLHKLVQYCSGNIDKVDRRNVRLADQVQEHLKLPLLKGDVQTSDWSRDLDYQQTQYAASDSYAGLQLFHVLEAKRKAFNPAPPRPAHAELNLAISLGDQERSKQPVELLEDGDESGDTESISSSDISIEELAREYFHVSLNDDAQVKPNVITEPTSIFSEAQSSKSSLPLSTPVSTPGSKDGLLSAKLTRPLELAIADEFAATFRPPPNRRVAPQALRAYSLWHQQGLSVPEVATILRQPPIQDRTVITYVCDAISIGNLNFEPARIIELTSEHGFRPVIKIHRDLVERARKEIWKAKVEEERHAMDEGSSRRS